MWQIDQGDCLKLLRTMPEGLADSLVTDPPAGIGFMGREWDTDRGGRGSWIDWLTAVMQEAFRVLKPGAHGLVWAIPRTSHWTATALEDAGFEIRDVITHHFGSGFPKSQNVADFVKKAGGDPEPWSGWGSALKPATEHWILVRKPLAETSIARNVLAHGTGALNIGASRVERAAGDVPGWHKTGSYGREGGFLGTDTFKIRDMSPEEVQARCGDKGRWPTNLLLSHDETCGFEDGECAPDCPVAELDRQSGMRKSGIGAVTKATAKGYAPNAYGKDNRPEGARHVSYGDSGGASRFFPTFHYFAKPSRSEREAGLDQLPDRTLNRVNPGGIENDPRWAPVTVKNNHPTVKGKRLMAWLIKLVTPPGGTVLDPFAGSGSTGVAAVANGFRFWGMEQNEEYVEIATKRLEFAWLEAAGQQSLFDEEIR